MPPKFELEDTMDYYTFYVLILGIPEDIFWLYDYAFIVGVAANMSAYNGWKSYAEAKERERRQKQIHK